MLSSTIVALEARTPLTWGELCLAIDEGRLPATLDGRCYAVRRRDVERWLRDLESPQPVRHVS